MDLLDLVLGQVSVFLFMVCLSHVLARNKNTKLSPKQSNHTKFIISTTIILFAISATAHFAIFVTHKLLLRYFGVTFSLQVWQHVDLASIELALRSRPALTLSAALILTLFPFFYSFSARFIARRLKPAVINTFQFSILVGLLSYAALLYWHPQIPVRLFAETANTSFVKRKEIRSLTPVEKEFLRAHGLYPISGGQVKFVSLSENPRARNLILIYLEAFDVLYTDITPEGFRNLTPALNALSKESTVFSHWFPAGGWTIAALFGSQCGTQLDSGSVNSNAYLVEKFSDHAPIVCFADVLKEAGFKTVFMGGASPRFSGKGDFLRSNGYDEVIGREWFENSNTLKSKMADWGLLDWELFGEAADKAIELHKSKERFLLTALTLNTHQPGYPQSSHCSPYPEEAGSDPLRSGAFCTDKALNEFLTRLEGEGVLADTAIWIQSDHPQFETQAKRSALGPNGVTNKRLVSILKEPGFRVGKIVEKPTTAFDFPASALDLLGVQINGQFQRGTNIFGPEFKSRRNVVSSVGFHFQDSDTPDSAKNSCAESSITETIPQPWSDCALPILQQLANLDQRTQHAQPSSLHAVLKDLRFELSAETNSPIVYFASDKNQRNLLLHLSGSEETEIQTENRPYLLEFSLSGQLVGTYKWNNGADYRCRHREAGVSVFF